MKIGVVAVDSGQLLVCDPGYLKTERQLANANELDQKEREALESKTQSAQLTFNTGNEGLGVIFHSGVGDGRYDVYATFKDFPGAGRRIQKVEIIFLD